MPMLKIGEDTEATPLNQLFDQGRIVSGLKDGRVVYYIIQKDAKNPEATA